MGRSQHDKKTSDDADGKRVCYLSSPPEEKNEAKAQQDVKPMRFQKKRRDERTKRNAENLKVTKPR